MTPHTSNSVGVVGDDDADLDDAADTLRFERVVDFDDTPTDPDATSFYDLSPPPPICLGIQRASARRRRQIRDTRENVRRLREALAAGWDIAPELAHEEQRLCALEVIA